VANWATLFRQKTRLPVVPAGVDPKSEWFTCTRYAARLPRVGCANRYRLSRQRTGEGASYQAVTYGGCIRCKIGAAHAAGLPTPTETSTMDESTTTTTNGLKDAATTARVEQRRKRNANAKRKSRQRAKLAAHKHPTGPAAEPLAHPQDVGKQARRLTQSAPGRALAPDQISTAAELLELAGYTVKSVRTPAGLFLQVI
jgi:hypothetical protein